MKRWQSRWDVTAAEQAGMTFGQVLTIVNLRRVEVACLLGLFTSIVEYAGGLQSAMMVGQIALMTGFLLMSLVMRRSRRAWQARVFVAVSLIAALLMAQSAAATMGATGRLTSGYLTMMLTLALLFVLPPKVVAPVLAVMLVSYSVIIFRTPAVRGEQIIAIENAGIVSVIAVVAATLIHATRRRDYEQKAEIRLQNDLLRDRNADLDSLMAITAHDLRSPLYGLRNLFDLAVRRAPQEPELPLVVLRQATTSLDAMLALATRLLDAHAAEHRPLARLVEEDVRGHVLAAVGRIDPLAQSADVRIEMDLPDRPLIATLDAGALAQILDNLLSNGIRFSPSGEALTIRAAADGTHAVLTVRDRGPGIDPARHDLLFKKFHRDAGERADGVPSTGMGLFIVATLADQMGAQVRCEPAPGGGAAFVVTLPGDPAIA